MSICYVAKTEVKKILRDKMLFFALLVIVLLPLAYGFLYLWAFWDPYGHTENIPLAIVNLDSGGEKNGSYYNAGNEIVEKLLENKNISIKLVREKEATNGLYSSKYYAIFIIPEDFTEDILSINQTPIRPGKIFYKARETNNFLAAKITKAIANEIISNVTDEISQRYIDEGIIKISKLKENASEIQDKLYDLNQGLDDLRDGSKKIKNGLSDAESGSNELNDGLVEAKSGAYNLWQGASTIASSSNSLSKGIDQMVDIIYVCHNKGLINDSVMNSVEKIQDGNKEILSGQKKLSDSSYWLYQGLISLSNGSKKLNSGIDDLHDGTVKLYRGLDNVSEVVENSTDLFNEDYYKFINDYPDERIRLMASQGLHPITLEDITSEANPNYGTGLAPYFIQLSLWVGGLILLLVLIPKDNRLTCSKFSKVSITLGKYIVPAIIGIFQAVVLDLVLIYFLGLSPKSKTLLFVFTILLSLTFIAIIQLLIFLFGKAGEIPAILLLMLQLTSSAGTFPIETSPHFFQMINPFLPMTYGMIGLRQILLEGDISAILIEMVILTIFLISALSLRVIFTKKRFSVFDLHPLLKI